MQISQAQRDYKELLENPPKKQRYSSPFSPGKDQENQNTNNFGMRSGSAGAAPSNEQLLKLESEIGDIKKLLQNQQQPSQTSPFKAEPLRDSFIEGTSFLSQSMNTMVEANQSEEEVRKYISQQKVAIKQAQEKLKRTQDQYESDKRKMREEDLQNTNPGEYLKQKQILDDAKVQIGKRIDQINQRVEKIKAMEKRINK